jgi:RNA polymerase sigma factor (sigma-70 family)
MTTKPVCSSGDVGRPGAVELQKALDYAEMRAQRYKKYALKPFDVEEAARNGVFRAWEMWEASRGVNFLSYARTWADGACLSELRRQKRGVTTLSLEHFVAQAESLSPDEHTSLGFDPEFELQAVLDDRNARLRKFILALPELERQIIWWRYFEDATFSEICRRLGRSHTAVNKHQNRALEKIKNWLQEPPNNPS